LALKYEALKSTLEEANKGRDEIAKLFAMLKKGCE
jgi:hypothetical protein